MFVLWRSASLKHHLAPANGSPYLAGQSFVEEGGIGGFGGKPLYLPSLFRMEQYQVGGAAGTQGPSLYAINFGGIGAHLFY